MSLSAFFSSFVSTVYNDAPAEEPKEVAKDEEAEQAEPAEEPAAAEEEEEEEPEDVSTTSFGRWRAAHEDVSFLGHARGR